MSAMLKRRALKRISKYYLETPTTPENNLVGRLGAVCVSKDGGADTSFYLKETGDRTDTGWVAVVS